MAAVLSTTLTVAVDAKYAELILASTTGVRVGHVVVIGAEQAQVIRVGPLLALTVSRGVNGTAAAAHAADAAVVVYVPNDLAAVGAPDPPFAPVGDVPVGQGPTAAPVYTAGQAGPTGATGPQGPGDATIHLATVTLTNAQILALNDSGVQTPFELVATPGANKLVLFERAVLASHIVTPIGWTDPVASDPYLFVATPIVAENHINVSAILAENQTGGGAAVGITLSAFFAADAVAVLGLRPTADNQNDDLEIFGRMWSAASLVNLGLMLRLDTGFSEDLDLGGPLNTLTVHTFYRVLNLTTGLFE